MPEREYPVWLHADFGEQWVDLVWTCPHTVFYRGNIPFSKPGWDHYGCGTAGQWDWVWGAVAKGHPHWRVMDGMPAEGSDA